MHKKELNGEALKGLEKDEKLEVSANIETFVRSVEKATDEEWAENGHL